MKKREIHDGRKFPIFIHSELDDLGLDPFTFRIYGRLARRAGERGAFESVPNMAKHCKMSERQVRYSLKILLQFNLIRKTEHPGKPANYTLTDLPEWKNPQEETTKEQPENAPAPDAPLHHMQPTPAPYAGLPLHHMQPKVIHDKGTPIKREIARAFPSDENPFTTENPPIEESDLKAEKLFHIIHEGCNLPPKLDRKIEKRIYNCVDNLMLGFYSIPDVEAFISEWRQSKSLALTPERLASDIGEWRRLRKPAPVLTLPPPPNTTGMTAAEERRALLAYYDQCQQIKQQGVAA